MLRIAQKKAASLTNDRPYLRSGDASKVLGISKTSLLNRMREARYNIRFSRDGKGYRFDLEDVFRTAYPFADDELLAHLIMEFRGNDVRKKSQSSQS